VIAFQLAVNLYTLPSALGTRPVAVALLPRLARLSGSGQLRRFRDELVRAAALVAFLTVPAAVAYLILRDPLARAVTFGQMAAPPGRALVAVSIAALTPGLIGYAALLLGTHACYARRDARSPFHAALLRAAVAAAGMVVAFQVPAGPAALLALGLTFSAADIAGGARLVARLRRVLPVGGERLGGPLARTLTAATLMSAPAYLVADRLPALLPGSFSAQVSMVAATAVGAAVYFLLQWWWRSPELTLIRSGLVPGGSRPPGAPATGPPGTPATGPPGAPATGPPGTSRPAPTSRPT
jgi:putative peptidoglycan lipid II flippase